MMQHPRPSRSSLIPIVITAALVVSACGGGGNEAVDSAGADGPVVEEPDSTAAAEDPTSTTTTTTTTSTSTTTTTSTSTTDGSATDPVPLVTLEALPDLVVEWAAAGDDPSIDPLELARRLVGFPLHIPVAEGSTAFRVDLEMSAGETWRWSWTYSAFANRPVPDVDITMDGNGPGAVELAAGYDPIMGDLGFRRTGTTGSDPGARGGPNSVNHVYSHEGEPLVLGGPDGPNPKTLSVDPVFVWLDEELVFGEEGTAGYRVDVELEAPAEAIVVPLLDTLFAALPRVDGSQLATIDFSSFERPEDSFGAPEGLRYLDLIFELELPPGSEGIATATFSSGLDEKVYRAAEESFFDPGFHEPAEPLQFEDRWEQPILVLDRYPGRIDVTVDPGSGDVTASLGVRFEPNRELLAPLPA